MMTIIIVIIIIIIIIIHNFIRAELVQITEKTKHEVWNKTFKNVDVMK